MGLGPGGEGASSDNPASNTSLRTGVRSAPCVYCPSGRYTTAEPFGGMPGMVARTLSGALAAISLDITRKSSDLSVRPLRFGKGVVGVIRLRADISRNSEPFVRNSTRLPRQEGWAEDEGDDLGLILGTERVHRIQKLRHQDSLVLRSRPHHPAKGQAQRAKKPGSSEPGGRACNVRGETIAFGQRRRLVHPAWTETSVFGQWRKDMRRTSENLRLRTTAETGAPASEETSAFGQRRKPKQPATEETNVFGQWRKPEQPVRNETSVFG